MFDATEDHWQLRATIMKWLSLFTPQTSFFLRVGWCFEWKMLRHDLDADDDCAMHMIAHLAHNQSVLFWSAARYRIHLIPQMTIHLLYFSAWISHPHVLAHFMKSCWKVGSKISVGKLAKSSKALLNFWNFETPIHLGDQKIKKIHHKNSPQIVNFYLCTVL